MKIIRLLKAQVVLLIFLISLSILSATGIIPSVSEMTESLQNFFKAYGMLAVGAISFLENIVGINAYFPGSVVILVAMAMTSGNISQALIMFLCIYLPTIPAHNINYFIGKTSSNQEKNKSSHEIIEASKKRNRWSSLFFLFWNSHRWSSLFFVTFWHPHFTALSCMAAGAEGLTYRKFLIRLLLIGFVWNLFWGIFMYHLGGLAGAGGNLMPLMFGGIIAWAVCDCWKYFKEKTKYDK